MTGFINEADQIPVWWATSQWNRHTRTIGNGEWRYTSYVLAADRRCLLKREPATLLQEFVIAQEYLLYEKAIIWVHHIDYQSIAFSVLSFPHPHSLIVRKIISVCAQAYFAFWSRSLLHHTTPASLFLSITDLDHPFYPALRHGTLPVAQP